MKKNFRTPFVKEIGVDPIPLRQKSCSPAKTASLLLTHDLSVTPLKLPDFYFFLTNFLDINI